jgi:hypothetical protein
MMSQSLCTNIISIHTILAQQNQEKIVSTSPGLPYCLEVKNYKHGKVKNLSLCPKNFPWKKYVISSSQKFNYNGINNRNIGNHCDIVIMSRDRKCDSSRIQSYDHLRTSSARKLTCILLLDYKFALLKKKHKQNKICRTGSLISIWNYVLLPSLKICIFRSRTGNAAV